jgi:hypothetical protein
VHTCVEVLVNEYWAYDGEPFHVVRFVEGGSTYLYGLTQINSRGISQKRELCGWLEPSPAQVVAVCKELTLNAPCSLGTPQLNMK